MEIGTSGLFAAFIAVDLPTTWFIDQEGIERFTFPGSMTKDMLRHILDGVAAGREPDPFLVQLGVLDEILWVE